MVYFRQIREGLFLNNSTLEGGKMKTLFLVVALVVAILSVVQMSPAIADSGRSGRDMTNDPTHIENQAKLRAALQAPIIAMHGHWHDDFFEMKLKTPIKNKILDMYAHYSDGFKPLPTDQKILDSFFSKSDQFILARRAREAQYLDDCVNGRQTRGQTQWGGNCTWLYTGRLPKNKKEEAKYREKYISEYGGDIEDRAKKFAQLEKARKAKEKEEISRQRKYNEAIAKYNKYLEKNPDVKIAIDREQAEIDRLEHEEWEKSDIGIWSAEIRQRALEEVHAKYLKVIEEHKKHLDSRKEVLIQREVEAKKWREASDKAENKDSELEKKAESYEWSVGSWRIIMEKEAKEWQKRKHEIKEQDILMDKEVLDQE